MAGRVLFAAGTAAVLGVSAVAFVKNKLLHSDAPEELELNTEQQIFFTELVQKLNLRTSEVHEYPDVDQDEHLVHDTLHKRDKFGGLEIYVNKERSICVGYVQFGRLLRGHPTLAHGGSICTILDEYATALSVHYGYERRLKLTQRSTHTRFRKPIPIGKILFIKFEVKEPNEETQYPIEGTIFDENDIVYAENQSQFQEEEI
eukprot:CAMPEP_0115042244 /NCGR_PEP_ID=MMETSP0216-20121206/46155_1 /TAXON_ID=223996 /ORGANISM="Protocruzia adherens, Strain Boccale" /LENGTH=202 /DNA_ID=CAMNT_0002424331 /DNA_START=14 /DNA_END=622 /DNA_ORIENTATION=-